MQQHLFGEIYLGHPSLNSKLSVSDQTVVNYIIHASTATAVQTAAVASQCVRSISSVLLEPES